MNIHKKVIKKEKEKFIERLESERNDLGNFLSSPYINVYLGEKRCEDYMYNENEKVNYLLVKSMKQEHNTNVRRDFKIKDREMAKIDYIKNKNIKNTSVSLFFFIL